LPDLGEFSAHFRVNGTFFCCEHCAEMVGVTRLRDRVGAAA
jgi:hypothetical protein